MQDLSATNGRMAHGHPLERGTRPLASDRSSRTGHFIEPSYRQLAVACDSLVAVACHLGFRVQGCPCPVETVRSRYFVKPHVSVYLYSYIHIYIYIYIYIFVCFSFSLCTHMHIYIYIYIHMYDVHL